MSASAAFVADEEDTALFRNNLLVRALPPGPASPHQSQFSLRAPRARGASRIPERATGLYS